MCVIINFYNNNNNNIFIGLFQEWFDTGINLKFLDSNEIHGIIFINYSGIYYYS